jgi:tRNA(Ile)-lysidine synthase
MERLVAGFREKSYILAFSGGSDSLALALLLSGELPAERIVLFHLDHSLREESAAEAEKVRSIAEKLSLRVVVEKADVFSLSRKRGKGVEEAGRAARYLALERVRERFNADYILTAHQAEDLTETVLLKLVKGMGPGGLVGIPPKKGRLLRPLLGFTKGELRELAEESGLEHVEDSSNGDLRHPRNALRARVLPLLRELNPALERAVGRASQIALAEEELWEERLDELFPALAEKRAPDLYALKTEGFLKLRAAEQRRLLGGLFRRVKGRGRPLEPPGLSGVEAALEFIRSGRKKGLDFPSGRRVERRGGEVLISPASRFGNQPPATGFGN